MDVRFATRALALDTMAQDVSFVRMRIASRPRARKLAVPVLGVVAQALVLLGAGIAQKCLPGTRQLWNDRVNGARAITLEHLMEIAALGTSEASAVARALEYCLAFVTPRVNACDVPKMLAQLQRSNARLVALCIESPDQISQIRADAIEVASVARQIAGAMSEGER